MIKFLRHLFRAATRLFRTYDYGTLQDFEGRARQHRFSGRIEFVLWEKGQQGNTEDYWAEAGSGHVFVPDKK